MTALLTDNLPLLAGAPNGIRKLRELILELAVRGKLVPQDPSDEPASELLKRIAEEKTRLVAEGKIKKQKPLAEIGEEERPFELPEGWEWVRLGEIAEVIRGVTYGKSDSSETLLLDYAPLLRANNINRVLNFEKLVFVPKNLIAEQQYVRCGDVVIAMSSGSADLVGKAAQAEADYEGAFGAFCGVVRARNFELFPFFGFFFQTPIYRRRAAGHGKGIGINNLQKSVLETLEIPLPPLAEQHRIVAKVDELMALCERLEARQANAESAHARLVQALLDSLTRASDAEDFAASWQRLAEHFHSLFISEASIDALKQTLLQLAVMGKLVPQDPSDEPASDWIERIENEKARLVEAGQLKKTKKSLGVDLDKDTAELPASWHWVTLAQITLGMDSGWSPACEPNPSPNDDVWGVLKTTAVQVLEYLQEENKELPKHLNPRPEAEVKVGDILFTRAGPTNRVGVSCLVESTRPKLMISDKIIRFHPVEAGAYGRYIALCLNAGETARYLEKAKSGMAASQVNISQEKLKLAPIPMAPLPEQHRIVAKVDQLMALCDQLKARLTAARQLHERLSGALVDQAVA